MNPSGFVFKRFPDDFYGNFIPESSAALTASQSRGSLRGRFVEIVTRLTPPPDFAVDDRAAWREGADLFWKETRRQAYTDWDSDSCASGFRTALDRLLRANPPDASPVVEYGFLSPSHCWYEIVEAYTRSKLSFSTDRFTAISGIVKRIEERTNRACIAGLWEDRLATDLLWFASERPGTRIKEVLPPMRLRDLGGLPTTQGPQIAPTWSWMSVDAVISIDILPQTADSTFVGTNLLTKCSASVRNLDTDSASRTWNAVLGVLEVEGPFAPCTPIFQEGRWQLTLRGGADGHRVAAFFPDLRPHAREWDTAEFYYLSVLAFKNMDGKRFKRWDPPQEDVHGLVLRKAWLRELSHQEGRIRETGEAFVRVGYFSTKRATGVMATYGKSGILRELKAAPRRSIIIV
jgi:hypothetical protein